MTSRFAQLASPRVTPHPGYSVHPQVFELDEMRALGEALRTSALARTRAGARHVLGVPAVRAIANDPRMIALARAYRGGAAIPYRATLFDKSSTSNWLVAWHQDLGLPMARRIDDPATASRAFLPASTSCSQRCRRLSCRSRQSGS